MTRVNVICDIGYGAHWQCSSICNVWYISLKAFHIFSVIYVMSMLQHNLFDLFFSDYFFFHLVFVYDLRRSNDEIQQCLHAEP